MKPTVSRSAFGKAANGASVDVFTLSSGTGAQVRVTNLGAAVVAIEVPDREGRLGDIVLGYDDADGYASDPYYLGVVVGRYANRIAKGRFALSGVEYELPINNMGNHLHGGPAGFHTRLWTAESFVRPDAVGVALRLRSHDGDQGYPGNLDVSVVYTLEGSESLRVDYSAVTDRPTVVNLTQHSYFNLNGAGAPTVLDHWLWMSSQGFTPVDETSIPLGPIAPVEGTPFDFRTPRPVGDHIDAADEQLRRTGGYDHNWVLDGEPGALRPAARLFSPASGRVLDVLTTEPGIQMYAGNCLVGPIRGKGGASYQRRSALCLETQHYPDSPNQPGFPSAALLPGATYSSTTVFRFSAVEAETWPSGPITPA